jgi:hypothetical protein
MHKIRKGTQIQLYTTKVSQHAYTRATIGYAKRKLQKAEMKLTAEIRFVLSLRGNDTMTNQETLPCSDSLLRRIKDRFKLSAYAGNKS